MNGGCGESHSVDRRSVSFFRYASRPDDIVTRRVLMYWVVAVIAIMVVAWIEFGTEYALLYPQLGALHSLHDL